MSSSTFLPGLMQFPKDSINEETVELMTPYLSMEDYNLETAKKVSCLHKHVYLINMYHSVVPTHDIAILCICFTCSFSLGFIKKIP